MVDFSNGNSFDSLRETIEANYRQIKQEFLFLIDSETKRIMDNPRLCHPIKSKDLFLLI